MRILQICSARSIGGGENYLIDLSNSLTVGGQNIFAALAPESPLKTRLDKLPSENFLTARLRNSLDVQSAFEIARFAKQNNIGLLHAHLAKDYPPTALASQITKIPFVLTRHVVFPMKSVHKFVLKNVRGIIAPSNAVAVALKKQNLFPAEKIETIHYGINLEHFSAVKPTNLNTKNTFTIGTIGNLAPVKGHDIFLRAARLVLNKLPETKFVVVGEDRSASRKNRLEIENLIDELDIKESVELAGWTNDVRPFLQKFDLYVSASRSESFGLSIVEAMMQELPVVATQSDGAREIIKNGVNGGLVPIEDFQKLADEIIKLMENPQTRKKFGEIGKKHVEQNFSLEAMVHKTLEFYRRILQK